MARLSKAHQALLDKLGQMDLEPPQYDEIIARNDQIMMMEEEIQSLNDFVSTTFEEYKTSNRGTANALDEEIRRVEEQLREEKAQLEELIKKAGPDLERVFQSRTESLLESVKEELRKSQEVQDQKMAYLRQQQVKVQSDLKLGIQALRNELGLTV